MSITYNASIPADGNPEGIVDAPLGSLFHKNGAFYKVNHSGSAANGWVTATFTPYHVPNYYLTSADIQVLTVNTGSYLYTKTTIQGTPFGWRLLSTSTPFIWS